MWIRKGLPGRRRGRRTPKDRAGPFPGRSGVTHRIQGFRRGLWLVAALVPPGLFAGCVNQQKEVAHYERILHAHPATTAAARRVPRECTLADAMRLANDNNEQLAISGEDYLQALIARNRAFASFLPTIGLGVQDFQQQEFNTTGLPPDFSQFFQTHYFNLPLQTQLNVNAWRDAAAIQAAGTTVRQRRALLRDMQSNLLLEVARTYYGVLSDERSVKVLRATLGVQKANVASMKRKEKAGIVVRLSVLQSRADESATRVLLTHARNSVQKGRAVLAFLIGAPNLGGARLVNRFDPPSHVPALRQLDQISLRQRQDLRAADDAVATSRNEVSAAVAEYFPSVSIDLNTFLSKQSFPSDSWWNSLFSVNIPIFEGGMIYDDIRTAYSRLRQTMLARQRLAQRILEEVRIARDNWISSVQLVRNLLTEMRAARAAFHQARHSFQAGLATSLDVITAQDRALAAQLAYEKARYNERINILTLMRMTGRLTYPAIAQLAAAGGAHVVADK